MKERNLSRIIIFVIFHDDIRNEYYSESLKDILVFVNVTPNNPKVVKIEQLGYQVINQYEFQNFISLGKHYAESEVIYNVYKNPYLIQDVDYIGFIQYDMHTHNLSKEEIESLIGSYQHIAFDEHNLRAEYKVRYLMDESRPEKWIGRGRNCYDAILEDYNKFYGSNHTIDQIRNKDINLCCTFLLEKNHFNQMMVFISNAIESEKLKIFDTKQLFRMQGGLMERYFGIWLCLNQKSYFHRPIEHIYNTTNVSTNRSFVRRLTNFIKRKIG